MATLEFCDKHNMVAYLEKPEGSAEFHQIIDFLTASHIHYALTENPTIYASFIKQFWTTATASTNVNGEVELTASIDGQAKTITEASLRRHLKLEDNGGITSLPNTEIFEQLALMGYATDSDKLTFQKGNFSPQWRFFIHTILHCLSPKKTSWEQFSSNIATAIICLATNRTFNFSKFIFDAMVKNLDNPHKFLMYPRFIQICLNKQRRLLQPHTRTYPTPVLTQKVFSNMKRVTRGYSGEDIPLFPSMITAPETSPSRITSSPSLSPQHTPVSAPSTSPPPITETTPTAEEPAPMPYESPLQSLTNKVGSLENELTNTKKVYGSAITKLVKRVKKLEKQVKTGKARRRTKIVLSEDEAVEEDSSKQGRSLIEELDMDADFSLVPLHDAEIQENISDDTEVLLEEEETTELIEEPTELVEDQGNGEKGNKRLLLLILHSILLVYHLVLLVQLPRSLRNKCKKKGLVMKKPLDYKNRLMRKKEKGLQEMLKLPNNCNKNMIKLERKNLSVAEVKKNMIMYLKNQGGYKMKDFKGMSYDDIRPIFEKIWDQIHSFVPMDSKEEVQRLKRAGQDAEAKLAKRQRTEEVLESVQEQTDELSQEQLNQMVIIVPDEEKGQDIFMLVEKDYPLTKGLATLMLSNKLKVDQQSEMADELLTKIYNIANKPRK
ncbi:hypothetical protein Tco_0579138 [Tanacetum coccineum]